MVRRWFAVLIVLAVAMPLASTTPQRQADEVLSQFRKK